MPHAQITYLNGGGSLPDFYGEDRLVILPRDPHNIFAYWEVSLPTRSALEERAGADRCAEACYLLRIYKYAQDNTETAESFFDREVGRDHSNWYSHVTEADRFYRAELGWRLPGEPFQPILRSNLIRTPRDTLSNIIDENWQLPDWKARKLFRRISMHHLSSAEFFRRSKKYEENRRLNQGK